MRAFRSRWLCLALGTVWAIVAMSIVINLHVNPDHLRDIEGRPVMHTVYARDSGLWLANFLAVGSAIAVAAVELALRKHHESSRPGVVALVLGSLLCVYSLFGLLYGLVAIGPIGVMILVSGVPVPQEQETESEAVPYRAP